MSVNMDHEDLFKPFRENINNRHEYAKNWKHRTGGKVIGLFNSYVPEEIIYAAGMLPIKVIGDNTPQTITDEYITRTKWCALSRSCLAEGLKGHYDYLDGIVMGASCFHAEQAFVAWVKHIPISFWHYIFVPGSVQSESAVTCLVGEFEEFKTALERWSERQISMGALDDAIEIFNENRRLMTDLCASRKNDPPMISGSEAMTAVLASQFMDKSEHNGLIRELLGGLSQNGNPISRGVRVMIVGSENNDIELLQAIESWGGDIVIDDHCVGTRYFSTPVTKQQNRLEALATRLVQRPQAPTKDFPERRRLPHVLSLAKEYKVEVAIIILQKFCEPHEFDIPGIEAGLNELNIPTVVLEIDAQPVLPQIRVRVESLLDMVRLEA